MVTCFNRSQWRHLGKLQSVYNELHHRKEVGREHGNETIVRPQKKGRAETRQRLISNRPKRPFLDNLTSSRPSSAIAAIISKVNSCACHYSQ